jgi:hypothetical protein
MWIDVVNGNHDKI